MKPTKAEYSGFFENYIPLVKENSVIEAMEASGKKALALFNAIPTEKTNLAYAPGKWSVKELVVHVMDTERIFAYRALSIARGETQKFLVFDENSYAQNSNAGLREFSNIVEEFDLLRQSNLLLFKSFPDKVLLHTGLTPAGPTSVNALGYAICGHCLHHLGVLEARYLK